MMAGDGNAGAGRKCRIPEVLCRGQSIKLTKVDHNVDSDGDGDDDDGGGDDLAAGILYTEQQEG